MSGVYRTPGTDTWRYQEYNAYEQRRTDDRLIQNHQMRDFHAGTPGPTPVLPFSFAPTTPLLVPGAPPRYPAPVLSSVNRPTPQPAPTPAWATPAFNQRVIDVATGPQWYAPATSAPRAWTPQFNQSLINAATSASRAQPQTPAPVLSPLALLQQGTAGWSR